MIKLFLNNNIPYTTAIIYNTVLYRQKRSTKMYISINFEVEDLNNIFLCHKNTLLKIILVEKTLKSEFYLVLHKVYYSSNKT